jgi:Retrotransposon gag protein
VWVPKGSSSQQAYEDFQESVFNRLGHRVKSGPPLVNKNLVITTSNSSHKKRRVVEQAEQHFSAYMAHVGVDDYEEDDVPEDITNVFFEPDLARAHVIVTRGNSRSTNPEMEHTAIKENERGRQEDPNKEDDEVSDSGTANPDELLKVRLRLQEQQIAVQQKEIKELKKQNDEIFKMMQSMQAFMMGGKVASNENLKGKPEELKDDNEIEERPSTSTRRPYREVNRSNENTSRMPDHQSITKKEVQELVRQQIQMIGGGYIPTPARRCGRPYPAFYDQVDYPKGYVIPKFKSFSGEGTRDVNPDQHLAHFVASCGNTGGIDALLLRQFPQSLTGTAFQWYYSLENDSIGTWDEMADAFRAKFAVMIDTTNLVDLANVKPNPGEKMSEYIARWRNLSVKCDHKLT